MKTSSLWGVGAAAERKTATAFEKTDAMIIQQNAATLPIADRNHQTRFNFF